MLIWNDFFPWCSHRPKRKRNLPGWTSF